MIIKNDFPILEFDSEKDAKLKPSLITKYKFTTNKLIITFFPEVINKLIENNLIKEEHIIGGENPIIIYRFVGDDVLITLGHVGCPACAGDLDLFNAMGITKVMFCGGGGVLDKTIKVGTLLIVEGAIRDEGFSYHYVKPSRYIYSDKNIVNKLVNYFEENNITYIKGITWTTDAIFRETADKVNLRKEEGAKIVEMEQAGCLAVAEVRGFDYGAIIYGGDDCSQEEWDNRGWRSKNSIRYDLVLLCKKLVEII